MLAILCDGTVWTPRTPRVPSALRKALSGISEVSRVATADATRRRSLSLTSFERNVFCVISGSESAHIRFKVKPAFGSMYRLFADECVQRPGDPTTAAQTPEKPQKYRAPLEK